MIVQRVLTSAKNNSTSGEKNLKKLQGERLVNGSGARLVYGSVSTIIDRKKTSPFPFPNHLDTDMLW